jgi:hypothetical protein
MKRMDTPPPRKYNQQRYWRYVFTPMILVIIAFGIYILFTMPDTQSLSTSQVANRINALRKVGNNANNAFSNVGTAGSNSV